MSSVFVFIVILGTGMDLSNSILQFFLNALKKLLIADIKNLCYLNECIDIWFCFTRLIVGISRSFDL